MHPELGRTNLVAPHVLRNDMETCRASERTQWLPRSSAQGPVLNSDFHLVVARAGRMVTVADLLELMGPRS